MKYLFICLAIVGLFVLCGCGGGGGAAFPPRSIAFLGDSITANGSYPATASASLGAVGLNDGVAGDNVAHIAARVPTVIAQHPTLCVLEAGKNDALYSADLIGFRMSIDQTLQALQVAGVSTVVLTITPFAPGLVWMGKTVGPIDAYNAVLIDEAARHGAVVSDANTGFQVSMLDPDGIHLNNAGQSFLAATVTDTIRNDPSWRNP